jgi:anaerobic selenocysteine-containing dehydrogenase
VAARQRFWIPIQLAAMSSSAMTGSFATTHVTARIHGTASVSSMTFAPTAAAAAELGDLPLEPQRLTGEGELHLVVYPSYRFYDGRLANRPWLQELPDPVSKHTWGTVVEIHPRTADGLGLDNGHIVEVATTYGSVEGPVWRPAIIFTN